MKKSMVLCAALVLVTMTQLIGCAYADVEIVSVEVVNKCEDNEFVRITVKNTGKKDRKVDTEVWEGPPWVKSDYKYEVTVEAEKTETIELDTYCSNDKIVKTEDDLGQKDRRKTSDGGDTWKEYAVGGVWVPVDKLGLLAPYIALTSTIVVASVATAIYVKRRQKK